MEETISREFWIPKLVTIFGVFAGFCNTVLANFFCDLTFTTFHLTVSLIYMALAVATTLYSIRSRLRGPLMIAAVHWSAVVLLTLPAVLGCFGVLPIYGNGDGYGILLWLLDAALFGVGALFSEAWMAAGLYAFSVLFAAAMLALIGWGVHKLQRR